MEVLISDPGARGSALARKIAESSLADRVFVAPGNPGTEAVAENTGIAHTNIDAQLDFVRRQKKIGLVVVSADDPLADGAVDVFESEFADRDLKVWGPAKDAAQIEWSKVYAKRLMQAKGIPTADFGVMNNFNHALYYADCQEYPLFVKLDKLFGGKGVERCEDVSEVESSLRKFSQLGRFDAENPVLLEAESRGPEVSLQAFCDGTEYKGDHLVVSGGRVLNVVTVGEEGELLESVLATAYSAADLVDFEGKQMRRDIGSEVLSSEFQAYVDISRAGWQ